MTFASTSTGFTVWFTGMSGAGKSTLAQALANRLKRLGFPAEVADGEELHQYLHIGDAQTKDERNAETRRLAWFCRMVTRAGGVVLQSAIESPYHETRDEARRHIQRFAEVFVECPIDTLIQRDKTGRYKKALAGELKNLVGISEPYEPPRNPEVIIDTSRQGVDDAVEHLVNQLVALRLLDPSQAGLRTRPKPQVRPKPPKDQPIPKAIQFKPAEDKPAAPAGKTPAVKPGAAAKASPPAKPVQAAPKPAATAKSAAPAKPPPAPAPKAAAKGGKFDAIARTVAKVAAKVANARPAAKVSAAKASKGKPAAKSASRRR